MALPGVMLHPSLSFVPQKKEAEPVKRDPLIKNTLNVQYAGSFFLKYVYA